MTTPQGQMICKNKTQSPNLLKIAYRDLSFRLKKKTLLLVTKVKVNKKLN